MCRQAESIGRVRSSVCLSIRLFSLSPESMTLDFCTSTGRASQGQGLGEGCVLAGGRNGVLSSSRQRFPIVAPTRTPCAMDVKSLEEFFFRKRLKSF